MNYCKALFIVMLPASLMGQAAFVSFTPQTIWTQKGTCFELSLFFEVEKGYHIQADPAQIQSEYLIPTNIYLDSVAGLTLCDIIYPTSQALLLAGTESIQVFDGVLEIKIRFEMKEPFTLENISGSLYYQTCDDKKCFFPRELAFVADLQKGVGEER